MFEIKSIQHFYDTIWIHVQGWIDSYILNPFNGMQIAIVLVLYLVVYSFKGKLAKLVDKISLPKSLFSYEDILKDLLKAVVVPSVFVILLWFTTFVMDSLVYPTAIVELFATLVNVWIVIRIASTFIKDETWSKVVSFLAWSIAALNIVGLLDETKAFLESLAFSVGQMSFSALGIIKGILAIIVIFWVFSILEKFLKKRILGFGGLTPSAKVLLSKFVRFALIFIGALIALEAMGIDLTALAVFSGAIGIGLGFGLQKVASNLVSGVILLVDNSVKPGDVIALGDTYGQINKLGGRYVSVITRDGTEHLIPNEELITQRVENWSFSDTNVRQKAGIGIAYNSDVKKAMALCEQAAGEIDRIVKDPKPRCLLIDFGDSSINIELRFWVSDAHNGLRNVRSEVLLRVWELFQEHNIDIPFPQRDLNINNPVEVKVMKEVEDDVS